MPKISVYLSDELYTRAKAQSLPLSALTQSAVEAALEQSERRAWIGRLATRPRRELDLDTGALLADVRSDLGQ